MWATTRWRIWGSAGTGCSQLVATSDFWRGSISSGSVGDRLDPSSAQPLCLHAQQRTPLPLIQMRAKRRAPRCRRLGDSNHAGHYHNRSPSGNKT